MDTTDEDRYRMDVSINGRKLIKWSGKYTELKLVKDLSLYSRGSIAIDEWKLRITNQDPGPSSDPPKVKVPKKIKPKK
jgi:hypothetical protein